MNKKSDIGLVGLAVMGENLALNMAGRGFKVSVFNRSTDKVDSFMAGRAKGLPFFGAHSLRELVESLERPRRIMFMVKAGKPVDELIDSLLPLLEPGDILIDGGNSNYEDSERRCKKIEEAGLLYVGSGVSGGEEGALKGPSLMPGGSPEAWPLIKPIFQAIAAKAPDGSPCCEWVGRGGSGHFVKMVHNGIEYGDMELICEAYDLLRRAGGLGNGEISGIFDEWNKGRLNSYLIEITRDILKFKDKDGSPLVDKILDAAGQKGTGKWTGISALEQGVPLSLITEAVFARNLSAAKEERVRAAEILAPGEASAPGEESISDIESALYASKIISYAQGYLLMRAASDSYGWELNFGDIALMWRGGCIIRSAFLGKIKEAFEKKPELENLVLDAYFADELKSSIPGLRRTLSRAVLSGIPLPAFSAALSYYDALRSETLPANLLQAQRDYFGAHTYERLDAPRGQHFHTEWK